ncbi:CD180 antigen-like [Diadema setosum]|uniref:CD180 antigen-like n=1 Tax=Diadema setosum TaxID=31175 RepID=UPI003B3A6B86
MHFKDSALLVLFTGIHVFIPLSTMQTVSSENHACQFHRAKRSANCRLMGLSSVPRDLPGNTEILDLSFNRITTLYNTSFFPYRHLKVLTIEFNSISFIDSGTFLMLSFLQSLDLSNNKRLPALRGDMFASIALTNVQLNGSNLAHVSDDIFRAMATTSALGLRRNVLQNVSWTDCHNVAFLFVSLSRNKFAEISEQSFVMGCSVDSLDLSENPIRLVSPATISSLKVRSLDMSEILLPEKELHHLFEGVRLSTTITSLYLRDIGLTSLRPGLFGALQGKQLRLLDLGVNRLRQLIPRGFENLTDVFELSLLGNELEAIEPVHFSGMSSLRVLSLVNNNISVINYDSGMWHTNLTTILLSFNNFERIGTHAFNGLKNLEVLDLSHNNLDPLTHVSLSDLNSLNHLRLADCSITGVLQLNVHSLKILDFHDTEGIPPPMLSPGILQRYTPLLQTINFENTNIHVLDLWDFNRGISSFEGLEDLRILNLGRTNMFFVPDGFFQNLTTLRELYLHESRLSLKASLLEGFSTLQILSLSDNEISHIPHDFLKYTIQLRDLSLAKNNLRFLNGDLFRKVNLTRLDLSYNKLVTLQFTTFEPILQTLSVLDLGQNPWVCNCSLEWLPKWVAKRSIELEYSVGTTCSYEGSFKSAAGKLLIEFDPVRECGPQYVLYFSLVAIAVCTTLGLVLIYWNRWKIRYRIFLCKIHFIGYREIVPRQQREDFQYDMCVVSHDEDEAWTEEIFRRGLEENLPQFSRLAIGDEALRLGMYYLDSVNLLVENSFKVVFLISAKALKNHMFLLKFRIALDHVNEVQMEKIVLVFLEKIPDSNLPFLVRLFLSDNREYLMWPRDPDGQCYFWEKLAKYMTVNRYSNPLVPP